MTSRRQRLLDAALLALAMIAIFAGGYATARYQLRAEAAVEPNQAVAPEPSAQPTSKPRSPEEQRSLEHWQGATLERLTRFLQLREDQQDVVRGLLAKSQEEIMTIRKGAQGEVRIVLDRTRGDLAKVLDDEQRQRFEKSQRRMRQMLERRPRLRDRRRPMGNPQSRPGRRPDGKRPPRPGRDRRQENRPARPGPGPADSSDSASD